MSHKVSADSGQTSSGNTSGKLYIVGTPIGNLEDITLRAIRILKQVDLIACEDTRHSQNLLNHYSIQTHTTSYHQHNEMTRAPELIVQLEGGRHVALVSDAGMPGISDPGFRLVQLAIRHGIQVIPVPGASALVAVLSAAGLPVDGFSFLGFLPSKKLARRRSLKDLKGATKALVFYESPHRVVDMLEDVRDILGDRPSVVAREITKIHEEFVRGSASEVREVLKRTPVKGEITVLVGGPVEAERKSSFEQSIRVELEQTMVQNGMDERDALKTLARRRGISKSEAYRQLQTEKGRAPVPSR